jgi:hypothetical protein
VSQASSTVGPVRSPASLQRLSVIGGCLWLAISSQLLFLALLAALISPAALVYLVLGVAALILAAILLTQRPSLTTFIAPTFAGLLATLAGLIALSSGPSLVPVELVLAFTATSLIATAVAATAARLFARDG